MGYWPFDGEGVYGAEHYGQRLQEGVSRFLPIAPRAAQLARA
jgi:hypothetical protein